MVISTRARATTKLKAVSERAFDNRSLEMPESYVLWAWRQISGLPRQGLVLSLTHILAPLMSIKS